MQEQTSKDQANQLKNIDFLAWQVERAKDQRHEREINRLIMHRQHLQSDAHSLN